MRDRVTVFVLLAVLLAGCVAERISVPIPDTVIVPAGSFIRGSDRAERQAAYALDERAYGHSSTRRGRWYDSEFKRGGITLTGFRITRGVITNRQYAAFVAATGQAAPVNRWVSAMICLFQPQIVHLLEARDIAVAKWESNHPGVNVYEGKELEITSAIPISLDEQLRKATEALAFKN